MNKTFLIFKDGTILRGHGIGRKGLAIGEICFNTAMTGYQEIISDPSYKGQIINFTFPHIGNVGVNDKDNESRKPLAAGIIVRNAITASSNYRATSNLDEWLLHHNIIGISGVDTRAITTRIRKNGAEKVAILNEIEASEEIIKQVCNEKDLFDDNLVAAVSTKESYSWGTNKNKPKIILIDYGAKRNIMESLNQLGANVLVMPFDSSFDQIMLHKPDGVMLSNGPGDPMSVLNQTADTIKKLVEAGVALFGICLGHQLLALSFGAKTCKMHHGHRGANHPVQNLKTGIVEITSQNHGFSVDEASLPSNIEITHRSLFDNSIEGIRIVGHKAFSVQYHPESSPGPHDSAYLFKQFLKSC